LQKCKKKKQDSKKTTEKRDEDAGEKGDEFTDPITGL